MPTQSTFVPQNLDATKWDQIEPLLDALMARKVETPGQLEAWLVDRGELEAACNEAEANLYITMTCRTDNPASQAAFLSYIETIPPKLKPRLFELDKRQVQLRDRIALDQSRYHVLDRGTKAAVEIFRPENVPIQTELERLSTKYQEIIGAMTVTFEGKEQTLPQMARYQESTDRAVREAAFRAVAERRARDADAIDLIFNDMVVLRDRMARNAGFKDFVGYTFKARQRFDYTPQDCFKFHEACEKVIVPFLRRLDEQRRKSLGVDTLRPWDKGVDVKGRPPLRPFEGGADLVRKTRATLSSLDPRLERMFATLGDGSEARGSEGGANLDLDSRKGKAPGGYQYMRDRIRKPFIFMNAAGLHRDVETMVHEAGHAFHSMLCVDEPLLAYRGSPIEFAEVASMSMELLTMRHWGAPGGFYPSRDDLARATRQHIESSVSTLAWIATIDAFQHWIYSHPVHTRAERTKAWLDLEARLGPAVSWEGLDRLHEVLWHRQPHLFGSPFYYIEYGIAQLGALQLWIKSIEQGEPAAIDSYFKGLSLGASKPLPDLFKASGLTFDFGLDTVARLAARAEQELAKLPV